MVLKSPFPNLDAPSIDIWNFVFKNPLLSPQNRVPDDRVVLLDPIGKRELTFGQVRDLSRTFAYNLQTKLYLRKGECLGVFSPNCLEYVVSVLGGPAMGAYISPASVAFSVDELVYQLKNSGAKCLVTHAKVLDTALKAAKACNLPTKNLIVIQDPSTSSPRQHGCTEFASLLTTTAGAQLVQPKFNVKADLLVLPYSSGTTGRPKGVRLSHHNVVSNLVSLVGSQNKGEVDVPPSDERMVAVLPFSHIYGLSALVYAAVLTGKMIVVLAQFDLVAYLELVQRYRCNIGYVVPPILTAFAKHPIIDKYDVSSLREVGLMCAAAPLSAQLIDAVYKRLRIPVFQAFGMTEASPLTHFLPPEKWQEGKGGVGHVAPNVESRIVDEHGNDVAPGEVGEIWVRGPNIFLGYHNNPEATADCMTSDGFYKTGDIGRVEPSTGIFYITDRLKELIKYKGYQVPPAELEGVLSGNPKVADVAVVGVWDESEHTEVPRAFIVLQGGNTPSKDLESEICNWLEKRVAHYKRLRGGIKFVTEIPKNSSGKIMRRVLRQQIAAEAPEIKAKM
ncbi:uncharacterized protein PV09_08020 [Verruconis gallopava]|uniref:4-coumarate-CoA ligase n=1 Tax=Verruconis gallopava TaxID=253628 RepID=A0A0D2A2F8_9PEZI|nr:uncharacterized protein PV09_08020 [Verruconis gallopava]KIW00500.1 hypothetical protein PV09_08020 [Verruconis gallopava]